jgi:hypothetical protein
MTKTEFLSEIWRIKGLSEQESGPQHPITTKQRPHPPPSIHFRCPSADVVGMRPAWTLSSGSISRVMKDSIRDCEPGLDINQLLGFEGFQPDPEECPKAPGRLKLLALPEGFRGDPLHYLAYIRGRSEHYATLLRPPVIMFRFFDIYWIHSYPLAPSSHALTRKSFSSQIGLIVSDR